MGNCSSCKSKSGPTAKLIFLDGELRELSSPFKVSQVLEGNPRCFVCSSDEMDFGDFVSAIDADEELQLGQLYFVLPLSWLAQPLQAKDMAFLAAKASLALATDGGGDGGGEEKCTCFCCTRKVGPLLFSYERHVESRSTVVAYAGGGDGVMEEKTTRRRCGDKGCKMTRKLSLIPEEY